jgi:hypothetical protein
LIKVKYDERRRTIMTPEEMKNYIIERKYFVGWEIAMFLKQLYPERFKSPVRPGADGVLLPGGCKLTKVRQGNKWFLKSYSYDDINIICNELSQFKTINTGSNIGPQSICGGNTWMPIWRNN